MIIQKLLDVIEKCDFEIAINMIMDNEAKYGENVDFIKAKAILCIKVGEFNTAINLLKQAKMLNPNDNEVYFYLSFAYEQLEGKQQDDDVIIINSDNKKPAIYGDDLNLYKNRIALQELISEPDDPLVSIVFIAYNNLERLTKPAIECLLKYTQNIDYELILIDNGSTDGTFEYFKSIPMKKKIYRITKNIGAFYGHMAARNACRGRFTKGKYIVNVPNDVLVTKNWLKNMLICVESDEKIGIVVPMTDNCSNYQTVDLGYKDFDDMQAKAALFNVSNSKKWEERIRVIPFLSLIRCEVWNLYKADDAFIYNFADDDLSIQYRRLGYKLIVCGDVFVHHEGSSVVAKNQDKYIQDLEKGRKIFKRKYLGLDAWNDIASNAKNMVKLLPVKNGINKILGIDVCCGASLLEIKNKLPLFGLCNHDLSAFSQQEKYWQDLKTICNKDVVCGDIVKIDKRFQKEKFDYILIGSYIQTYKSVKYILNICVNMLETKGILAFKIKNIYDIKFFCKNELEREAFQHQFTDCIDINVALAWINEQGYKLVQKCDVCHSINNNDKSVLIQQVERILDSSQKELILKSLFVDEYILVIEK